MPLPPQPLSHDQRRRVCALLAMGATRRMAAEFADCRVMDLVLALKHDPAFKQQVLQHELRPEIEVLRSLFDAAREPKQWRASAWFLERLYPRRYAARKSNDLPTATLQTAIEREVQQLVTAFPDPKLWRRLAKLLRK